MDMILGKINLQIVVLIFSIICCKFTLELHHRANFNVYITTYVFSINDFFTVRFFFKTNSQQHSLFQWNEHVDLNKLSSSLSCIWMTIIDFLFYASDSLS